METLIKDVKWSLRMLRRQPGFAAMVIITLALGIGANTALFSVVNAVLLQPLPYHEPDRLVRVWSARPEDGVTHGTTSTLDLQDWFEQNASFEDIGGYPALHMRGFVLTGQDRPEEIATSYVAEGFFETLAAAALHGRTIERRDHVDGSNTVVVLSYGAWRRRYGADPSIVGETISLSISSGVSCSRSLCRSTNGCRSFNTRSQSNSPSRSLTACRHALGWMSVCFV